MPTLRKMTTEEIELMNRKRRKQKKVAPVVEVPDSQPEVQQAQPQRGHLKYEGFTLSTRGRAILNDISFLNSEASIKSYIRRFVYRGELKDVLRKDLNKLARYRKGLPVGEFMQPVPKLLDLIERLHIKDDAQWTMLIDAAVGGYSIKPVDREWFINPTDIPAANAVMTASPAQTQAIISQRTTELFQSIVDSESPLEVLEAHQCLQDAGWMVEIQNALYLLNTYLLSMKEGSIEYRIPPEFVIWRPSLKDHVANMQLFDTGRAKSPRWHVLISIFHTVGILGLRQYNICRDIPLKLTVHIQTCQIIRGILGKDMTVAESLRAAVALYYEPMYGSTWPEEAELGIVKQGGKAAAYKIIWAIAKLENTFDTDDKWRGYLSMYIHQLLDALLEVRLHGERINAVYPDGISAEVRQTYDELGLENSSYWGRLVIYLLKWKVLRPAEASAYLSNTTPQED